MNPSNQRIELNKWQVCGHWPYVPLLNQSKETSLTLKSVTDWIDAEVPGSVYQDLWRAGYIDNPYYEQNSLLCEWVANRWWVYRTEFEVAVDDKANIGHDQSADAKKYRLTLNGIDYKARILLNDQCIGQHEGMVRPFEADITDHLKKGTNILLVVLENAPEEMAQIGLTSETTTQKSRFGYKWDFGTRLVNLGLCGSAWIDVFSVARLSDLSVTTVCENDEWMLNVRVNAESVEPLENTQVRIALDSPEGVQLGAFTVQMTDGRSEQHFTVKNAKLWWPNGYGEQPLYTVRATLLWNSTPLEERVRRVGLRTLSYRRVDGASDDSLPYQPILNGRPIHIKGTNLVPLDHVYGCVTKSRYRHMLTLLADAHVTLVRVWGGGIIEAESFYDLCDELGLMVWQEFMQSSSGIDNVPSEKEDFLKLLSTAAEWAVREKRQHVCLTFWSGGNELCELDGTPCSFDNSNLAMLQDIVARHNPEVQMLPTSASGPLEYLDNTRPGCNHDVHGQWQFLGVHEHYTCFNRSDSQLHSEFGCNGMGNLETVRHILAPEHQLVTDVQRDLIWRHHGEWWCTFERDSSIFGSFAPEELDDFIRCSQFIQAEGLRYGLEANRRRMGRCCGSILWQANEPWPNVTGTNIIDYYGQPKLAYYAVRDAFRPRVATLKYEELFCHPDALAKGEVFVHNDGADSQYVLHISAYLGDILLAEEVRQGHILADTVHSAGTLSFAVPKDAHGGIMIRLVLDIGDETVESTYLRLIQDPVTGLADRHVALDSYERRMKEKMKRSYSYPLPFEKERFPLLSYRENDN